jgi:hypothetical protein
MGFCGGVTFSKLAAEELWRGLSRSPEKAKADDASGRPLSISLLYIFYIPVQRL